MRLSGATTLGADLLVPEPEGAQRGLVVEVEETGRSGAGAVPMLDPVPRRHREHVARLPRDHPVADPALALPLDHVDDLAPGPTLGGHVLAGAQPARGFTCRSTTGARRGAVAASAARAARTERHGQRTCG